jgi:hypothetical protein
MMGVASTGTGAKRFFSFFIVHRLRTDLIQFHIYFSGHQNNGSLPAKYFSALPILPSQ